MKPASGAQDQITVTVRQLPVCCGALSLTRGRLVVYNCCWFSQTQPFSCLSPAGLMTIFYCLRFDTPPSLSARTPYLYHPGTGWSSYTSRLWVPLSPIFELAATRGCRSQSLSHILRPIVIRPVRPGVRHPSRTRDQFVKFFFRRLRVC
jgi:hypothetical protein